MKTSPSSDNCPGDLEGSVFDGFKVEVEIFLFCHSPHPMLLATGPAVSSCYAWRVPTLGPDFPIDDFDAPQGI